MNLNPLFQNVTPVDTFTKNHIGSMNLNPLFQNVTPVDTFTKNAHNLKKKFSKTVIFLCYRLRYFLMVDKIFFQIFDDWEY